MIATQVFGAITGESPNAFTTRVTTGEVDGAGVVTVSVTEMVCGLFVVPAAAVIEMAPL